jgi:hypothetical protein
MSSPDKDQMRVTTDALRKDAQIWDDQSTEMGKIVSKTQGLRLNRVEAGLFQVIFDTYAQVIDQVTARSDEGQRSMTNVGSTLFSVANGYEQEEAARAHNLGNIHQ